ncbi:MAG: hypothetical protein WCJ62_13180, partial [Flavobacterium sp.]
KTFISKRVKGNSLLGKIFGVKNPVCWTDTRVYYNQKEKMYTIELKNNKGFKQITAYPIKINSKKTLSDEQQQYTKLYARYMSILEKRRAKINKNIIKEKLKGGLIKVCY